MQCNQVLDLFKLQDLTAPSAIQIRHLKANTVLLFFPGVIINFYKTHLESVKKLV